MACLRLFASGPVESDKYRIEYAPVGMGSAEEQERRDQEKHDLDIKVATPASILAAREGISLEDAAQHLADMARLSATEAPSPPSPVPAPVDTGRGEGGAPPASKDSADLAPQSIDTPPAVQ